MKNDNETYDVAEEQEIAAIVYNKEEYAAMGRGDGVLEVSLSAQAKSDEARRKYAISFWRSWSGSYRNCQIRRLPIF